MATEELGLMATRPTPGRQSSQNLQTTSNGRQTTVPHRATGDVVEISDQALKMSAESSSASSDSTAEVGSDSRMELKLSPEELRAMVDPESTA